MDQAYIYSKNSLINQAIDLYHLALETSAFPVKVKTYRNLGILYLDTDNLDEAGKHFDTCYMLIRSANYVAPYEIALTDLYYGQYLVKCKDPSALDFLNNSLAFFQDYFGSKHRDVAHVLTAIGDFYFAQGEFNVALEYYQQGLISITQDFNEVDVLVNPSPEEVSLDRYSLKILSSKARVLENLYLENSDLRYLESSLQLYDLMIYAIEQYARFYRYEDTRMLLTEDIL